MEYKEMIEKLGADFSEKIKTKIDEAKTAIKEERSTDLEGLKTEINGMLEQKLGQDSEFVKNMQTQLDSLEAKVKEAKEAPKKTLVELLKDNKDAIETAKSGERASLNLKAGDTILVGDYAGTQAFDGDMAASQLLPGVANIPTRQPYLRQLGNTFSFGSGVIYWTEQESVTDEAGNVLEGELAGKSSAKWIERSATMQLFSHYMKASRQSLDDYDYLSNQIRSELIKYLELEFDRQLGFGDTGTGDAVLGLVHLASDFDASVPGLTDSVTSANKIDVIRAVIAQIMTNHFIPSAVILSPGDAASLDLVKDDNGAYVMPPFTVAGNNIAGVRIVSNSGMVTGSFLVGQFDRMSIPVSRDITIEMYTQNEDDALKELVTMKASIRSTMFVRENHKKAFVSGVFNQAIDQLSTTTTASSTTAY